jgi:hypothetical protein
MIRPQITYNNGTAQTLSFVYPPTKKPRFSKQATRTDVFSTAGVRQTVVQRVNETFPLTMATILDGDDTAAWQQFLDYAIEGEPFEYYPDADNPTLHFTMFLQDTDAQLAYVSPGVYSLSCTLQKEIS